MALKIYFCKFLNISCYFGFICNIFYGRMTTFIKIKVPVDSQKAAGGPIQCLQLLSNASYDFECICFKRMLGKS